MKRNKENDKILEEAAEMLAKNFDPFKVIKEKEKEAFRNKINEAKIKQLEEWLEVSNKTIVNTYAQLDKALTKLDRIRDILKEDE